MPNYVKNIIIMYGSEEDKAKVREYIKGKDTAFDFNKLIPMPEALNIECSSVSSDSLTVYRYLQNKSKLSEKMKQLIKTMSKDGESTDDMIARLQKEKRLNLELGRKAAENFEKYGAPDFYYWRISNWGTKWNAMDASTDNDRIVFETAWSAPLRLINVLSARFPQVEFEYKWSDEDIGQNCGEGTFCKGETSDIAFYGDCSNEALRLYKECWGNTDCIGVNSDGEYYRKNCAECHGCD